MFFKQKNFFVSRREKEIDTYHIRLSLTEESTRYPDEMSCREESMKLDSEGELENLHNARANDAGYVEAPLNSTYINVMDKNRFKKAWINGFSSITSGQNFHYSGDSIVKEMQKVNEDAVPEYIKKVMLKIFHDIDRLGGLLLCHCEGVNTGFYGDGRSQNRDAPPSGGATRKHTRLTHRRKRLLGRKGKKSYRKKKYSKTKKSRRFRRSVRSRR